MYGPGTVLAGRYRLAVRIGTGGMGEVWRATDNRLERTVAVKVIKPDLLTDEHALRRFRAEALAMARVRHPGVVVIHDVHHSPSEAFLVMEYVKGEALAHRLSREGQLMPATAMKLTAQAAEALQSVHDLGIVHRDVKPSNLLLPEADTILLTDFGIAQIRDATRITATEMMLGTPSYMSPEQALGQPATFLSDVYSLGVVAYECLTGRRPFERDNPFAIAMARVHESPPTLAGDIPPVVCEVVERAMAREPEQRWPSAARLAAACRRAITSGPAPLARPLPPHTAPPPPAPTRPPAPGRLPPAPGRMPPPDRKKPKNGDARRFRVAIDPAVPVEVRRRVPRQRTFGDQAHQNLPNEVGDGWVGIGMLLAVGGLVAFCAGRTFWDFTGSLPLAAAAMSAAVAAFVVGGRRISESRRLVKTFRVLPEAQEEVARRHPSLRIRLERVTELTYQVHQHGQDPAITARLDLRDDLAERLHYELVSQLVAAGELADAQLTAVHAAVDARLADVERLVVAAGAIRTQIDRRVAAVARERSGRRDPPPRPPSGKTSGGGDLLPTAEVAAAVRAARAALEQVIG
jgi:serine/threonine protein kinase